MIVAEPAKSEQPAGGRKLRPLHIPRREAMTIKQAVHAFKDEYGMSTDTIRRLVKEFRLANQTMPGAPLRISATGLAMVFDGDHEMLSHLGQDDRVHENVRGERDC